MNIHRYQIYLSLGAIVFLICGTLVFYFILDAVRKQSFAEGFAQGKTAQQQIFIAQTKSKENERLRYLQSVKQNWQDYLFIANTRYATNAVFGTIRDLNITVANESKITFESVKVKVEYIRSDGSLYDTEYLSLSNLHPDEHFTTPAPSKWRGSKVKASIASYESKALAEVAER